MYQSPYCSIMVRFSVVLMCCLKGSAHHLIITKLFKELCKHTGNTQMRPFLYYFYTKWFIKRLVNTATMKTLLVSKGPFIATQLNSTRRRVELSCVAIDTLTDAIQLSPTIGNATDPVEAYSQSARSRSVELSWVELCRRRYRHFADATQLNLTLIELSCVAIDGPLPGACNSESTR